MNVETVRALLKKNENAKLDFKAKLHDIYNPDHAQQALQWNELIKDVIALINGNTGTAAETAYLLIGAADKPNPTGSRDLYDVGAVKLTQRQILDKVNSVCDPPIPDIKVDVVNVDATSILIIAIPPSPYVHRLTDWLKTPRAQYCPHTVLLRRKDGEKTLTASPEEVAMLGVEKNQAKSPEPELAQGLRDWFAALGYSIEKELESRGRAFFWILQVPGRRRTERIALIGIDGEGQIGHVRQLINLVESSSADGGWLVAARRISSAARKEANPMASPFVECFTADELIDQEVNWDPYLDWLDSEVRTRQIDSRYVPLSCKKDDFDPETGERIGTSHYGEDEAWIDGYIDRWLEDPAKEHISILGEFGTGKTWFAFHYAWILGQRYALAKKNGTVRPRLPLLIQLRDYTGAFDVENVLARFFFSKHNIRISNRVFDQLNRMGRFLLIFDGFDEMADKIDRQKMINNFWQLARLVVPASKAMLTCRTEHFPNAQESRALFSAELPASLSALTREPPQFETLELNYFDRKQIRSVLLKHANPAVVKKIQANKELMNLASRPVMIELLLEALPEIGSGKPVDISRVYLYAVRRKMERDIGSVRTFTSLADKLYFLCELSHEMLRTENMSINYRSFPEQLRRLFGPRVEEQKDLDHWHYDMMGQTMLIRNEDGDYAPAHRSLLEFFVAYKFAAELGILAEDFVDVARQRSRQESNNAHKGQVDHTWNAYFRHVPSDADDTSKMALRMFLPEHIEALGETMGSAPLSTAVLTLMSSMVTAERIPLLFRFLQDFKNHRIAQQSCVVANVATVLLQHDPAVLAGFDLSDTSLRGLDFHNIRELHIRKTKTECQVNLTGCVFDRTVFSDGAWYGVNLCDASFKAAVFSGWKFHTPQFDSAAFVPGSGDVVVSSHRDILLWKTKENKVAIRLPDDGAWSAVFSPCGRFLVNSAWGGFIVRNPCTLEIVAELTNSVVKPHPRVPERGRNLWTSALVFSSDSRTLFTGSNNGAVYVWDVPAREEVFCLNEHTSHVDSICVTRDGRYLASGSSNEIMLWDASGRDRIFRCGKIGGRYESCAFSLSGKFLYASISGRLVTYEVPSLKERHVLDLAGGSHRSMALSPDGRWLCVSSKMASFHVFDCGDEGRPQFLRELHSNLGCRTVSFSSAGDKLVTTSAAGYAVIWAVEDWTVERSLIHLGDFVSGADFSGAQGLPRNIVNGLGVYGAKL